MIGFGEEKVDHLEMQFKFVSLLRKFLREHGVSEAELPFYVISMQLEEIYDYFSEKDNPGV